MVDILHYVLDAQGNPVAEPDTLKWARWLEDNIGGQHRVVGQQEFTHNQEKILVSTVFLGTVYTIKNSDQPALYETMVFAENATLEKLMELSEQDTRGIIAAFFTGEPEIQKRYATKDQAIAGHKTMCDFVELSLRLL